MKKACRRGAISMALGAMFFGSALPCVAELITFPANLTVQHDLGTGGTLATSYVDVQGYRFVVSGSGMIPSGTWGGLWIGEALGVARNLQIFRPDGQNFAINSFGVQEHPAGFFDFENFVLYGYNDHGQNVAAHGFQTDGYSDTPHLFSVLPVDPDFSNLDYAWIVEDTWYVLQSIDLDLNVVPEPGSFLLALLAILGTIGTGSRRRPQPCGATASCFTRSAQAGLGYRPAHPLQLQLRFFRETAMNDDFATR